MTTKSNAERKSKRNEYEEKLMALHRHASQLSSATNVDEIVKYTLDAMEFTLGFSSADFSFVDAERRCLRLKGKRGRAPSFSELPLDGPGVTVKAANTGRTIRVLDTRKEEAYVDDEGRAGKEASPSKLSELAVPVVIDETVVAVLNVENNLPNAFVDDDQKLLETLATHAASALRRLKEQEVLMTQARILESTVEGVNVCDDKGVIFFTNPAFENMFGYKSGELIGKHVSVLNAYPPEENTMIVNDIIQTLKTKGAWFGEVRNRKKDGTVFTTSAHTSALEVSGKEYWISVQEDITERKRIGEALRRRVRELAALQETVLDITGRHDLPELLNSIVERAARLLGATGGGMYLCDSEKQEVRCVVGYNTATNIVGTVMKYGEGAAGMVATTGKPLIIDDYRTWPGRPAVFEKGQPFSALLSAPMTWQGQVTGVIHVLDVLDNEPRRFMDADLELLTMFANHAAIAVENTRVLERLQRHSTELERLVEERTRKVQESEKKYRQLVENALDGIWVIDAESKTTFVNQRMADMLGYTVDEMLGASLFHFMDEKDIAIAEQNLERRRRGIKEQLDFEFLRKDGTRIYTNLNTAPTADENGNFVGAIAFVRDITERKRLEERLRESETRFRGIAERSIDMIFVVDMEGQHTYVSPAAEKVLGYTPEEILGNPETLGRIQYHLPKSEVPRVIEAFAEIAKGKTIEGVHGRMKRKDGSLADIEINVSPIIEDGKVVGAQGVLRDITKRKQMEEGLGKLSWAIEQSPIIIMITDTKGNIEHVNRKFTEVTGYTLQEAIRMNAAEVGKQEQPAKELMWNVINSDREWRGEFRNRKKNGELYLEFAAISPVRNQEGITTHFVKVAEDITERRQMEEELRATKERLEHMVASNPAVIYAAEPRADSSDYSLTYISDRVSTMLGFEPREFIGHPEFWERHVPAEDKRSIVAEMPRLWKEGQLTYEYRFLHKDGTYRWIREEARVVCDADGKPTAVNGYWTDVTERKQMEETRDRLIAAATHELRTPLGPLKVHVDYVLSGKLGPIPEKLKPSLQVIKADTDRLIELTEALLDVRRLQTGRFELNVQPLDLLEIIHQGIEEMQVSFDLKKQRLYLEVPDNPLQLQGDAARLNQVLINLLSNASKYSPEGGKITIRANEETDVIRVQISDAGIGISKEDLSRVFEPFATVRKPAYVKGAGLGLNITKGIVEAHGGKLWAESEGEGKGATFTFTLPKLKSEN